MIRKLSLLLVLLLAAHCSAEAPAAAPEPADGPLAQALAEATQSGRAVLAMYTSETCGCCERMEKETLADPEVKEMLGKMVFVRLTKGKDAEAFETRFKDTGTPSFVVLGADGTARGEPQRGPFDAGEFLCLLDWVVENEGPQPAIIRLADGCGGGDEEGEGCGGCGEDEGAEEGAGCGGCGSE